MILTESEVRTLLLTEIAKYPSVFAYAREHKFDSSIAYRTLDGKYHGGGFPPSMLTGIGVRKRVIYELIEDPKEMAA